MEVEGRAGWRRRPAAKAVLHGLLAACLPVSLTALDSQCKNTLFQTHWFGKSDIETLNSIPTVKTGLKLCKQFNREASCCSEEFEKEQLTYYNYFRDTIFVGKMARVALHWQSVADVRHTAAYDDATYTEREQYKLAMEKFAPVLDTGVHAECLSTILQYTAGMNCFACKADWFEYVHQHHNRVIRVNIDPGVCIEVWSHCEEFGRATQELKQAVLDSVLVKQAKREAENLDVFFDQQSLCNWLHVEVALHPFQRPSEMDRETAPKLLQLDPPEIPDIDMKSDESRDSPFGRLLKDDIRKDYNALVEGGKTGFDLRWENVPVGAAHPSNGNSWLTSLAALSLSSACIAAV
eukprot:gnl/TRDRNA2_/TRDRNA2_55423_c0_seq1.p1 gnl/TRDRNA2_/TRDRNA2_55423_c0~~gnl/TRDRNA2_/TRDRNA2_55423_c0_seq1.p1  ORF type:complete len:361 (-),score=80.20 gnl/TRDRNA2_/TRDRNA2_55423_c0_seq1:51-1100(-)